MSPKWHEVVEASLWQHLEDLSWHSPEETLGLKRLHAQISLCLNEVLKCTLGQRDSKACVWAFRLLENVSKSHAETAYLVTKTGLFGEALEQNLQLQDHCEQETLYCALSLALRVAMEVPESTAFQHCTAIFVGIASDSWEHKPFRALQIQGLHILIHLCYSRISRRWVSDLLEFDKVHSLLDAARRPDSDGQGVREHTFAACMLLASLCDVQVYSQDEQKTVEDANVGTFAYFATDLWREEDFFVAMAACIAASARHEPWPPLSATQWVPWKLAQTCERLARHGYAMDLRTCVVPLATLVVKSGASTGVPMQQPARTARLAIEAVRSITSAAGNVEQFRDDVRAALGTSFEQSLRDLREEHPAADDLLDIFCGGRDPLPYLHVDLT